MNYDKARWQLEAESRESIAVLSTSWIIEENHGNEKDLIYLPRQYLQGEVCSPDLRALKGLVFQVYPRITPIEK